MKFGPQNKDEAAIFALEELRADVQYQILKRMKRFGMTQAALAKKMKKSPAWVSQILDDDANLTLESIAKIFLALESRRHVATFSLDESYHDALWDRVEVNEWDNAEITTIVGRQEAADFASVVMETKQIGGPRFVQKTTDTGRAARALDCLEAA